MKFKFIKISILLIAASILTLSLSSCGLLTVLDSVDGIFEAYDEFRANEDITDKKETDGFIGSTEKVDDIIIGGTGGDGTTQEDNTEGSDQDASADNDNAIQGNSSGVAYAAAKGLRSSVSIYSKFSSGGAGGSGVIYALDAQSGSAFIVTNYHVVYSGVSEDEDAISGDITVYLYGMEQEAYGISASFVGGSPKYDVAVLRIDNSELLKGAAARGAVAAADVNNKEAFAGQNAIAIGNAEGLGITVTSGIVSVDSEYIDMSALNGAGTFELRVIRIDTAINSGNSGGGLFDGNGRLIGIINSKSAYSEVEHIGYAIPVTAVRAVADNVIYYCYDKDETALKRPILGITVQATDPITSYDKESGMLIRSETVVITEIEASSIAKDNFATDDVLKSITVGNRTVEVTRLHHVIEAMLDARVGDSVTFKVIGVNGEERTETIKITADCLVDY